MNTLLSILALIIIFVAVYSSVNRKFKFGPLQRAWIDYLRAHPEEQYKGSLGKKIQGVERCCCLGRGGIIAGVCKWAENTLQTMDGSTGLLEFKSYKALGLRGKAGEPKNKHFSALSHLNDSGKTWLEIADILEKFPKQYFIHSV